MSMKGPSGSCLSRVSDSSASLIVNAAASTRTRTRPSSFCDIFLRSYSRLPLSRRTVVANGRNAIRRDQEERRTGPSRHGTNQSVATKPRAVVGWHTRRWEACEVRGGPLRRGAHRCHSRVTCRSAVSVVSATLGTAAATLVETVTPTLESVSAAHAIPTVAAVAAAVTAA